MPTWKLTLLTVLIDSSGSPVSTAPLSVTGSCLRRADQSNCRNARHTASQVGMMHGERSWVTPGTVVVERLRGKISFTEDVEFILRKGMTESFNFSKGVKASWEGEDTMVVQIERPNPNRPLKLIDYIPSLVAASLISERLSRPVFIEDQELKGDVLTLRIGLA